MWRPAQPGVPLNQPAEVVSLTFRGRRLQRFRTPEGEREMRLTLDERTDETVSQLRNLPVWTAEGDKIPLAAMADFRLAPGPERIERENRRTGVRVGAPPSPRPLWCPSLLSASGGRGHARERRARAVPESSPER